jgi:glycosyltransferase involved in cell wall biosynthesis
MLKLDFHSPATTEKIGYGRAYFDIRAQLQKIQGNGISLVEPHTGGDVQIYFGSMWRKYREFFERKSEIFMIYTMFESTEIPMEWLDWQDLFDAYIVPSEWNKQVFIDAGIKQPIFVIPLGVRAESWPLLKRNYNGTFNIIWQGTSIKDRKGSDTVQRVFEKMKLPDCTLTLKLNPYYFKHKTEFDIPLKMDGSIRSIGMRYSQTQMLELLQKMHLSVYPSTGEGFGLIPVEHMATGLPVILSNNTAMSQFCDRSFNLPVQCTEVCSRYVIGEGYQPDEDEIEFYIQWAYDNREDARRLGESAAEWVKHNWTVEITADKILKLAKEVANVA